jgi:hypothetical protein
VKLLLEKDPPIQDVQDEFSSTPLGWAINGSKSSWLRRKGRYREVVGLLLRAGARPPDEREGSPAVRAALEDFRQHPGRH